MSTIPCIRRKRLVFFSTVFLLASVGRVSAQFTAPTAEELAMTAAPQAPGAAAVYLFREETQEDATHMFRVYARLKVLTEKGKEYANVEVPFVKTDGGFDVKDIEARTIHRDGSIVLMTAKPFDKLIDKMGGVKEMAKVFALPAVDVGSILEYRYSLEMDDRYFSEPRWFIQSKLCTLKAHYRWSPTGEQLMLGSQHGELSHGIAWVPILPKNAEFKHSRQPVGGRDGMQTIFDLNVHDVPAIPDEEFMPPLESLTYRVIFYYSAATTAAAYWSSEGKYWSKEHDRFIGPGSGVRAAVAAMSAPGDTSEQKLRKMYAAVMALENTDYTREHTSAEEKVAGLKQVKNTDDVLARKRGSSDQLANLFIAMARASGFKAYAMSVTDRDRSTFLPAYLETRQLDDDIAIVMVDGKERFFDPGERYCDFGHLAWRHTLASGLRQTDKDAVLADKPTPPESYKAAQISRVASLIMDEHGEIKGTIGFNYTGDAALSWRHDALRGDETSVKQSLREALEAMLPSGLEVKIRKVEHLAEYDVPLSVIFEVSGMAGNSTGKRLLVPSDIFNANAKPTFSQTERTVPVYFHYASTTQDAVRITFPETIAVESVPVANTFTFQNSAAYQVSTESTATSLTLRRNLTLGEIWFVQKDYPELRTFYNKFETKDQEPVVFTHKDGGGAKPGS